MMRRIERENAMFTTRQAGMGGSSTAENLADREDAQRVSLMVRALKNPAGAAGEVAESLGVSSTTPETRRLLGEMLLSPDGAGLMGAAQAARADALRRQALARTLGHGVAGLGGAAARAHQ